MSATEKMCAMLDERGIKHETHRDVKNRNVTKWSTHHGAFVFFAVEKEGKLLVETTAATEHSAVCTPEQAIAATLGRPAFDANLEQALSFMRIWISDDAHLGDSELSAAFEKAEGLRKLDAIESAIAATLGGVGSGVGSKVGSEVCGGKLTAEQVREVIERYSAWVIGNNRCFHDGAYEAIADELNAALGARKAMAHPYGYEPDTGAFDVTRCECGCLNDISATYCNDCGGIIEIDMNAEKEIYHIPHHMVFAVKHDDGSLEYDSRRYTAAMLGDDGYEAKMDALLCRLTNGKWSKSRAYDLDFMVSCVEEEFEALYSEEQFVAPASGALTAEQVRETVEKHWHDLPAEYDMPESSALPEYSYDWQAIADELNAASEGSDYERMYRELTDAVNELQKKQPYCYDPGKPVETLQTVGRFIDELCDAVDEKFAALDGGKLTAEQVREAVERHSQGRVIVERDASWVIGAINCFYFNDDAYEAIADELNATMGGGECEITPIAPGSDMGRCSACGQVADVASNYCWKCGAKAVKR